MANSQQGWRVAKSTSGGTVQSVTGLNTDNTDPTNPIVKISVDGTTVTGDGTPANPLTSNADGVLSVNGLNTDNTDPQNPIVNISVDGTSITGSGTPLSPLQANAYQTVQEETVSIPQRTVLNFQGSGVIASDDPINNRTNITIAGSAGNTIYYMNQTINEPPYKEFSSVPTAAPEQDVPTTISAGATSVIGAFQTPVGIPNTTNIPSGLWQFYIHLYSGFATDDWDVFVEVYSRDTLGTETLLFTSDIETVVDMSTTTTMYLLDGVFPLTSVLTTDRIVVKINATNTGSGSQTIHFITEGSQHYSVSFTTLNQVIPSGAVTNVSGTSPIASTGGTTPAISISQSNTTTDGYLSSTDWNTFNNKVSTSRSISTTSPLAGGGDLSADRTLSISQSNTTTDGYLSSTDWNTFNNKQNALGFTPVPNTRTITTNSPLTGGGDLTANRTLSISQSNTTTDGYLSSTDWNTFNNKVATTRSISTTSPLAGGGDLSADRTLSISQSNTTTDGYLSSTDWNTFNNKQNALGFTPVPNTRNITVNGVTQDLTADRTYTVTDANISISDITTNNVSTTQHGFAPKLPNVATQYLNGTGNWTTPTSPSGVWGISNSSGVYTYYATLALAMASATSGQTVEMFADETATTAVTIKPNVIISGNGHTYTYSGNTGNVFATTQVVTGTYYFQNITILRANTATSTGAIFAGDGTVFGTSFTIKCSNTQVRYTTTTGTAPIWTTIGAFGVYGATFEGIDIIGNTSGYLFDGVFAVNNIRNSRIENTGTGGGISTANINGGTLIENTYVKTVSGNGIILNYGNQGDTARGCTVVTTSGTGISGGTTINCFAFSNSGVAIGSSGVFNCMASTVSGTAYYSSSARDSTGTSSTGQCVNPFSTSPSFYNCTFRTTSAVLASSGAYPAQFYNCSLENAWANASGHAISLNGAGIEVVNCYISVSDLSANCIRGAGAINVKYSNNSFKGATTPINANVTQSIVNTQDNQGNILL